MKDKRLLKSGAGFICMLLSLFFVIFVFCSTSLGWFAQNKNVTGSGISISPFGVPFKIEYQVVDSGNDYAVIDANKVFNINEFFGNDVSGIFPGDQSTVNIKITNLTDTVYKITSFGLKCNNSNDETSHKINGISYYLGTQISAVYGLTANTDLSGTAPNIVVNNAIWSNDNQGTVNLLNSNLQLNANGVLVIQFTVAFVDTQINQNPYQNFGIVEDDDGNKGVCRRAIYFTWEEKLFYKKTKTP